ncbi:IS1595 family transposase [Methylovulum miyakonense]|uniref:IS1595 family transposase n=1 Tax=Methylovulum miyakonense TaxID=645578 RepID=UPI00037FB937|nr:IS1595 family transposase [Methylovulum miyakonense]
MIAEDFKELLSSLCGLSHHQRNVAKAALDRQTDLPEVIEVVETRFELKPACPHCAGILLSRYGFASGLQRYRCQSFRKTFNALTGSPLARLRHKPKWPGYLAALAESKTVRESAAEAGVHRNTSFRWRHRFLDGISLDYPGALEGITEADETYLLESDKGKRNLSRQPRKRGGSAQKRGISDEQVCILVARDRSGHTLDFVTGNGQLARTRLSEALKRLLATDALLVSDGNPTYSAFCRTEGISHEAVNLSQHQRVKGAYHIQNVNAYHSRFKLWLDRFHGVATDYLPHYLGWRRVFEQHHNPTPQWLLNAALGNFQQSTVT